MGVLCGIPTADGILADIGGGSLELVRLDRGARGVSHTLSLGAIRLAERAGGDPVRARAIAEADLAPVPWLAEGAGPRPVSGGRRLARAGAHPHGADRLSAADGASLHDRPGGGARPDRRDRRCRPPRAGAAAGAVAPPHRRSAVSPRWCCAACCVRPACAGWCSAPAGCARAGSCSACPTAVRARGPAAGGGQRATRRGSGRDPALPPALLAWTDPLFPAETGEARRLREAACWMSDIGSHDHPEFRAEQAFLRVLRQPGIGLDHHARAFLALAIAHALRGRCRGAVPASGTAAAGCVEHAPGGGAGGGAAAGLHAVGGHAGSAGGHRAAAVGRAG